MIQCNKFLHPAAALAGLRPQAMYPTGEARIEFHVRAHGIEHLRALFQQARQDFIDVGDRKGVVRSIMLHGAFGARPGAVPGFAHCIALAHEQQILPLRPSRTQHRHGIGLRKAAQIMEMAVLPVGVFDIAIAMTHWRGREYGDGILADNSHELPPPPREFSPIH